MLNQRLVVLLEQPGGKATYITTQFVLLPLPEAFFRKKATLTNLWFVRPFRGLGHYKGSRHHLWSRRGTCELLG